MFYTRPVNLPEEATVLRYNNLSMISSEMVAEGSKSAEQTNYPIAEFDRIKKELKKMSTQTKKQEVAGASRNNDTNINTNFELQDPDIAQTKGRPAKLNKRTMPMVERIKAQKKNKYNCKICKSSGHNAGTCPTKSKERAQDKPT